MRRTVILTMLLFILATQLSWAQIPQTMSYQGVLTEVSDIPVADGNYDLTFSLYDVEAGGSALWTETQSVAVASGMFSVILGSVNPLTPDFGQQYWLGIAIGMGAELAPRTKLASSPYSMGGSFWRLAGNADTDPATHFIGTTDDTPLELWVDNVRALRLEPATDDLNEITAANIIAGYSGNWVKSGVVGAVIGGGGHSEHPYENSVTDHFGTISGGTENRAGNHNEDIRDAPSATVGGGSDNKAGAGYATVGGGFLNKAEGPYATIPGGSHNTAQGRHCFAIGFAAEARHDGCFVWGDDSVPQSIRSTGANQFIARASGGVYFVSSGTMISSPSTGVQLPSGGGAWSSISDRAVKSNFIPVDKLGILKSLASIPIETWNYKSQDPSVRHIGPMSQEFYSAFGVGQDDKHITTVDADGVALAAIQGLYELVREKDAKIAAQESHLSDLEARLAALEAIAR